MKREQARDALVELVEATEPGHSIPPERELSRQLGVSRPTLRAAVDDLIAAGLLRREHGRGTFTRDKLSQRLDSISPLEPAEGEWSSRVLEFEDEPAGARVGGKLRLPPDDRIHRIVRVRVANGESIAIERIHLPHALLPDLEPSDLEHGNFYRLLRERYEVVPDHAAQTIEPTVTDPAESRTLDVPVHTPALLFTRTTFDHHGRTIEFTRSVYRGDRYRLTAHLRFDGSSG